MTQRGMRETKKDRRLSQITLVRDAMKFADASGMSIRHVAVRRMVARDLESGSSDDDFRSLITYADPTGERAVSNVMHERGAAR
jgi:hypothetical protein